MLFYVYAVLLSTLCNASSNYSLILAIVALPMLYAKPCRRTLSDLWTFRPFVSSPSGRVAPETFRPLVSKYSFLIQHDLFTV